MNEPITQDRMEASLQFMSETDELCAALKTEVERSDYQADAIRDAVFLRSEGSVAARESVAKTHPEYATAKEKYFSALQRYESLKNKRSTAAIVIDTWRSLYSGLKRGII